MQKVDAVGRVMIPKNLREKFDLEKGNSYSIIETDKGLLVTSEKVKFNICEEDMKALRKLYIMLSNSGFLDSYYDEILSRITKRTDIKCDKCGEFLFLTTDNTYKCFKCGDE